jgi:hypothetical protein
MGGGSTDLSNVHVFPGIKKNGSWSGITSTTSLSGLWQGEATAIVVGTGGSSSIQRSSAGVGRRYTSGATINSLSGIRISANLLTERDLNPFTTWKITLNQTTDTRFMIGFTSSNAAPTSLADPLNALSGVAFFYDSSVDGNWHIMQNDGTGASDRTTIANVAAANTSVHTFSLKAVNASSKFQYSYDGGAFTDINTDIPAAATGLGWIWYIENLIGSAKTFDGWYAQTYQDGY